jgi:hypothetical protein
MNKINGYQLDALNKIADGKSLDGVDKRTLRSLRQRGLIRRRSLTPKGRATVRLHRRLARLLYVRLDHVYTIAE